ncbi:MAG TPA: hypothetical protein VMY42_07475 [Thermoguttaceae bacterium]|nr:hypothetical protein [Thermoguttaceae bacterium]
MKLTPTILLPITLCLLIAQHPLAQAGKLTVELNNAEGVALVGAIHRWDQDGNLRRPVDPKARIEAPPLDATAIHHGAGRWVFEDLPPGTYDLLIMAQGRVRIEGFQYAPVLEFDPFIRPDAPVEDESREFILDHIKKSRHYENKVVPLYLAGDRRTVRVLVTLIRDLPTSYEEGAGTIRHEIWQYTWKYGGWEKEQRTRVMDRILLQVSELRRWTWLWDTKLGGIEVTNSPKTIQYPMPKPSATQVLRGLVPY